MSSNRNKIRVIIYGSFLESKNEKAVKRAISERMIENGCPEGASVGFHLEKIITRRANEVISVGEVSVNNVCVIIKGESNKGIKGKVKPGYISKEKKMSLRDLESYLKPLIKKKKISGRISDSGKAEVPKPHIDQSTEKTEEPVKSFYDSEYLRDPDFLELIFIQISDSASNGALDSKSLTAREIKDYFDENNLFPDPHKTIAIRVFGKVLSELAKKGKLKQVGGFVKRPAYYEIVETPVEGSDDQEIEPVTEKIPDTSGSAKTVDVNSFEALGEIVGKRDALDKEIEKINLEIQALQKRRDKLLAEKSETESALEKYKKIYDTMKSVFG